MPLRHRHGYAADFTMASLSAISTDARVSSTLLCAGVHRTQPRSVRFELVDALRGV